MLSVYSLEEVKSFFIFLDNFKGDHTAEALLKEFGLSKEKSQQISDLWAKSYSRKVPADRRARVAYLANGGVL